MAAGFMTAQEMRTILITGCSTGIGRAFCVEFARRGYRVLATARKVEAIRDIATSTLEVAELDVTDAASIARLHLPDRDIGLLVNNAGFGLMGPLLDLDIEGLRRQLEVNVVAVLALSQAVVPSMIRNGRGRIVNISSISGVLATPFAGAYCSSKAAVNAMSDVMRMEFAPFGISVVTVQPGAIKSSFGENATASIEEPSASSVYRPISRAIANRAKTSQVGAMPAERFASAVIDKIARVRSPQLVRVGPHSRTWPLMRHWLPATLIDRKLSERFELTSLK